MKTLKIFQSILTLLLMVIGFYWGYHDVYDKGCYCLLLAFMSTSDKFTLE